MSHSHEKAAQWAANNGFDYHEEVGSVPAENASRLFAFDEYRSLSNHVSGRFLERDFHQIDVFKMGAESHTRETVLLIPEATGSLPAFTLVPRSVYQPAEWLGITGLAISTDAHTPPMLARVIEEANKHYQIHSGGFGEALKEAPDPAVIGRICKPEVLGFLCRHPGWFIESRDGFLAMWKPDHVMSGDERSEALELADEIMSLLDRADATPAIPGVEVTNPIKPKQVLGTVIGTFIGFFVGAIAFITLLFVQEKFPLLGFALIPLGLVVGGFLGNRIGRAMSP